MDAIWGEALFVVLVALGLVAVALAARDVLAAPTARTLAVGGAVTALVLGGLALTLTPVTASTGATCQLQPTTTVLGPDGAQERVDEAAPGTDRRSVTSCIETARTRTAGASACIVVAAGGYAVAWRRRRTRSGPARR